RVLDLARELYGIAAAGLKAQRCPHGSAPDERVVLEALEPWLERGISPADHWRERWHGDLGRSPEKLVAAMAL
ncbi:MAG TPA: hypothetical protein VGD74_01320, partial [Vulgatibacter sp.]